MSQSNTLGVHVAVVDSSVEGYQKISSEMKSMGMEVILIAPGASGVEQLTAELSAYENIASINLFSHGQAGVLSLGSDKISESTIVAYADQLSTIGSYLSADADLRLFGCDIGAGTSGQNLVKEIARLTGADVAASDDLTGAAALNGDWDLEVTQGEVAAIQLPIDLVQGYSSVLADPSITFDFDDNFDLTRDNGDSLMTSTEGDVTLVYRDPGSLTGYTTGDPRVSYFQIFRSDSAIKISLQDGSTFDFVSMDFKAITADNLIFTPVGGSSSTQTFNVTDTSNYVTANLNLQGVTSVELTAQDGQISSMFFDNVVIANVISPLKVTLPSAPTTDEDTAVNISTISISDSDNDDQTVTLTATNGNFSFSDSSQLTLSSGSFSSNDVVFTGTLSNINTALAGLSFTPTANFNGDATLKVQTNDGTETVSETLTIKVNSVNDAPVLDASPALELTAIDEDPADPVGGTTTGTAQGATLVSSLVTGVTDVDSGDGKGVAITSLGDANATLWYSLDSGTNWTKAGAVSDSSSLLLRSSDLIYFQPAENAEGNDLNAFTFRAWDQSSGTAGSTANTTSNGGATAFSTVSDTVVVDVTAINDAPVVTDGATHSLASISEDASNSADATVSDILSGVNYSDADSGAQSGIAITATEGNGTWQYDPDGNGNWVDMPAVSATNALLLSSTAKVRYVPDGENAETDVDLTFKAWDRTVGTASSNGSPQTIDTTTTGNAGSFSTGNASVRISVTAVNDSPELDTSQSPALSAIDEDSAAPTAGSVAGASTVSSLLGGVSDVDSGATFGMAVTSVNSDDGKLWYSRDNGTSWQEISSASDTNALLLEGSGYLYWQPNPDAYGTVDDALTFRGWDRSAGEAGAYVDVTAAASPSAYTSASDTVSVSVNNIDDAPTGSVSLGGVAQEGQALQVVQDIEDKDGLGTFTYVWRADGQILSDQTASTLVLTAAHIGKEITVTVEYTDKGGKSETITSTASAAVTEAPAPVEEGDFVDGATVSSNTETREDGSSVEVTEIAIVTEDREEEMGETELANVPLVSEGEESLLEVGLPTGSGMRIETDGTGTGPNGLIYAIRQRTRDDDQQEDQQELTGSGNTFLDDLPDPDNLVVRTLVPKVPGSMPTASPIKISGSPTGSKPVAVVIDTRDLPSGQVLILDDIEFGAIVGEVVLIGGSGNNAVAGDGQVQVIVLGEGDDVLHGGGGDDLIGSRGGDDLLYGDDGDDKVIGGAGNDTLEGGAGHDVLQGGASDAGQWTFSLKDNALVSRFSAAEVLATDTESFELVGPWWTDGSTGLESDTRLQFSYADNARLELVATLYRAVVGEKAELMDFNTFVNSDLSAEALANEALNFFLNNADLSDQEPVMQVRELIKAFWGESGTSVDAVAEGLSYINNGGSLSDYVLSLAEDDRAEALLANEDGELVLVQTYQSSETGWSSVTGDDHLSGGSGNDRLVGGDGNDYLDGGAGIDVAVFTGSVADFMFQVVYSDAAVAGSQPMQILLTRTVNGEMDTLSNIELLKIGGSYFELAADLSAYQAGTDYSLVDIVGQMTTAEVNALGIAGMY